MIARYLLAAVVVSAACGNRESGIGNRDSIAIPDSRLPTPDSRPVILFLGTSLTAGQGLGSPGTQAYPALIQQKLDSAGRHYRVVNAGVSGESSAGALTRVDWLLARDSVAMLVVETGANDALRGQNPDSVKARLQAILDRAKQTQPSPRLAVVGMEALPNLGREYGRRFRAIFPAVARANGAALVPFLLAGVGGVDSLNQVDGIHPTAAGHRIMAENVWKVLEPITR
ncbi:MAG: arylesterase [Gemmatimonadales bacterium]